MPFLASTAARRTADAAQRPWRAPWIPFGGRRRCGLGASSAVLEMKLAVRSALGRYTLDPAPALERTRRRAITISPRNSARVVLRERRPAAATPVRPPAAGAAAA